MSSLVLLGEQPSALELAALLERLQAASSSAAAGAAGGAGALSQLAKDGQLAKLLEQVAAQQALLLAAPDDDLTAALTLAFAVLAQLPAAADASAAATRLAALLTSDPATRPIIKIRTLTNLINVVGALNTVSAAQRFALLLQLLEFALAATPASAAAASSSATHAAAASSAVSPAALVLQPVSSLQSQIRAWKLSPADATALLLAQYKLAQRAGPAASQTRSVKAKGDEFAAAAAVPTFYNLGTQPTVQHEYLYAVLHSLDAATPAQLKEKANADLALQAALASASSGLASTLHQIDPVNVFQLASVQALSSGSASAQAAHQLLRILVDADLPAWVSFQSGAGAALLKENAALFDVDSMLRKVRTLALCALAVEQQAQGAGDNTLTYAQIAQKLQLSKGDNEAVEAAVIDAVMAGRLDAKMDQDAEQLVVKRVTGGVPLSLYTGPDAKAAWASLGARLAVWRENIHGVLQTLSAQHQPQQGDEVGEDMQ